MSFALQNQIRSAFPRELDAISRRSRGRLHDPRAAAWVPRGFEKWERIARGEKAQRIAEIVRRDARWIGDPELDQWVERVYCASTGIGAAGAAAVIPLSPVDALGGSATIVGYVQGELGVTIATGVSGWASQIGGTVLDFSQAGTTQQPIRTVNDATLWGRTTITSDGINDVLNTTWNPPAPGTTPSWIRCVTKRISLLADSMFAGTSTSTLRFAGAGAAQTAVCTNGNISSSVTLTTGTWYRTETLFSATTSVDYLKIGSGSTTAASGLGYGNNDPTSWRIFATTSAGANPGNYAMSKVLVLNAAPSTLQKQILDAIDTNFYNGNITL